MIETLKKAELHCHLNGILSPDYLPELKAMDVKTDIDREEFRNFYPITTLDEWMKMSPYLDQYQHRQGLFLKEVLRLHCQKLISQKVDYFEVMLTSILFEYDDFEEQCRLMDSYYDLKKRLSPDLTLNFLFCIARTPDRGKFEFKINRIVKLFEKGYISGFSLAGDESACDIKDYKDIFDDLHRQRIPVEIHAGEWRGPESIWDALEFGSPRRIGHGIAACEDPVLINHLEKEQIHLEICPTSNLILTKYRKIKEHPVVLFRERGLNFSINTDDPGHLGCTMVSEYRLLEKELGFERSDFDRIYSNSLAASFR